MSSALLRRRAERSRLLAQHEARPDLVLLQDGPPELEMRPVRMSGDGALLSAAGLRVKARPIPNREVRLVALSGIGDALWSRAVVDETLKAGLRVVLETVQPWAFWDFAGREGFRFAGAGDAPVYARGMSYLGQDLRGQGLSVFAAMCRNCRVPLGDFRLPLRPQWEADAASLLEGMKPQRPLMIYRPLLRNHGRRSVEARNPDPAAYAAIYRAIRGGYHVISVATDGDGEEIVHADAADSVFHRGELPVTTLAALMKRAALVYTNAGMALVLASALGTPVLGVMGGYEGSRHYADTAGVYGPALLIDPVEPCYCMSDRHACRKAIDLPRALVRARAFAKEHG